MLDSPDELFAVRKGGADGALTVSQFVTQAKNLLEVELSDIQIEGEVSSCSARASGHVYFTLSDGDAKLDCILYRSAAKRINIGFQAGDRLLVDGSASMYVPFGKFQFQVSDLRLAGQGRLYEQFLRLKRKLEGEGLFDAGRKRSIPKWPVQVGVVASAESAAVQDVLRTLGKRMPSIPVAIFPTLTQGEGAPVQIVRALQSAASVGGCDVLILCRGGGSPEDLAAYSDEAVARAIASSPIPVVTGIGHQTDTSIADFVADIHAHTPTAAAECCSPDRHERLESLSKTGGKLRDAARRYRDARGQGLDHFEKRLRDPQEELNRQAGRLGGSCARLLRRPAAVFEGLRQRLDYCRRRLGSGAPHCQTLRERLDALRVRLARTAASAAVEGAGRLDGMEKRLRALDYRRTLERGYSLVWSEAGELVRSAETVRPGERLRIRFHEGEVAAKTEGTPPDG